MSQKVPVLDGEIPLVSTGAEYMVSHISSERFVINAKQDGKVLNVVEDQYMQIQYADGSKDTLNLLPRYSTTKRNSIIRNKMNTLKAGDSFQKDQMIAYTNSFNGDGLALGKNVTMAIMNYNSFSHEDGYVMTNDSVNKFITDSVEKVIINIPPNTKIIQIFNEIGTITSVSDVLVEFEYSNSIDDYINKYEMEQNFQSLDTEIGDTAEDDQEALEPEEDAGKYLLFQSKTSHSIYKKSPGGKIIDFRIRINSKSQVDGKLLKLWNDQKKRITDIDQKLKVNKLTSKNQLIDNLDFSLLKTGSSKFEGALLEFYIEKQKPLKLGDKMANRFGAKGVVSKVIPKEYTPHTEFSGNIDVFLAPVSVLGRKNTSIIKELFLGKIIYNIPIYYKKELEKGSKVKDINNKVIQVYQLLDGTADKRISKSISSRLNEIDETTLRNAIEKNVFKFNFIMPPFSPTNLDQIKKAAALLDIPLNEHVYLPEFDQMTKTAVPVGISYMSAMEQLSSD